MGSVIHNEIVTSEFFEYHNYYKIDERSFITVKPRELIVKTLENI
jgi:hypothetical protein